MTGRARPQLFTIPPHRPFADALVGGLINKFGRDPLNLARGILLLPNQRALQTISEAFVRSSSRGLLLPRMVAIGDADIEDRIGAAIDPADARDIPPPAIDPLARRMILARLIHQIRMSIGEGIDASEAIRLAGDLARTIDQLLVEEVSPAALREIAVADELSTHWEKALALFNRVIEAWPTELERVGKIDLADRRGRLLDALGRRWRDNPPQSFVCAAGVSTAAPAIARLLRVVSELPDGMVVLPGLATDMAEEEWEALGTPDRNHGTIPVETHPLFQLKLLLARMGVARGEFHEWPGDVPKGPIPARIRVVQAAMAPAQFTGNWSGLTKARRQLAGVRAVELADPAEEAQVIALALRETLEVEGRTAALVTPDRGLARRVAAHLTRWGIAIDDSAGRPLSVLPPGVLLISLAEAAAQRFAPLPLLALLKHPLVAKGEGRVDWLENVRRLDLALRGPRPGPGLDGVTAHLETGDGRERARREGLAGWWLATTEAIRPLEREFAQSEVPPITLLASLREAADRLCGAELWAGPAGRAAADLIAELELHLPLGPALIQPATLAPMLRTLMDDLAVRPPQGGHPRLAIYGLIEARLQTADLVILGGLNEGVWPALPAPDPWLAPRIRSELGLPALERRIGVAAHDFVTALGAPEVLLTRARRDTRSPTIASRFLLRLQALSGGLDTDHRLINWGQSLDDPGDFAPARRPTPAPPPAARPKLLSVTEVDRLKADPYAFYARRMLGLTVLDPVDADPSAAWRGTAVHEVLEAWARFDRFDPDALRQRGQALMRHSAAHPLLRALWQPRLMEAIGFIADAIAEQQATGRRVVAVERSGAIDVCGIRLKGKFDRIDRLSDGSLAIVDYKTGKAPSKSAVREGYSMQLGLLGLIAERGGFADIQGRASAFEYWSLAKHGADFGQISSPCEGRDAIPPEDFVRQALCNLEKAASVWLLGAEPFTAKLHPEYAPYAEYDQLMRLDEWYGRD